MRKKSCECRAYKKGKVKVLVQDGFLVEKDKKGKIFPMSPTKIDAITAELVVTEVYLVYTRSSSDSTTKNVL